VYDRRAVKARSTWLVVVLIVVGAVSLAVGLLSGRTPAREGGAAGGDGAAPSPTEVGAAGVDAVDDRRPAAVPASPAAAAVHHGEKLARCFPGEDYEKQTLWGRGDRSAGVRFEMGEQGALLGAALWGDSGKLRSCVEEEIRRWRVAPGAKRAMRIDYPISRPSYGPHPGAGAQLLIAMGYYREELSPADVSGEWWAICSRDGGDVLLPTTVTVEAQGEGEFAGWRVTASACPRESSEQIVLLRGIEGLGRAEAAKRLVADAGASIDAAGLALELREQRYRLFVVSTDPGYPDAGAVVLERGEVAQVLTLDGFGHDLAWAGDIDGDGALDLIIAKNPDTPRYELFLSSKAGGRLVRRAATSQHMGD
jgi:hypothetical protein